MTAASASTGHQQQRSSGGGQRSGVSRVLLKLDNSIESGNYYEAHQMYRTLYFRYTSQKKFKECLDLLYNGAMKLLSKQQQGSAADLGLLLVTTLEKSPVSREGRESSNVDDGERIDGKEWIERLANIISLLKTTTVERETLIQRSIKWSGELSQRTFGDPHLHKLLAQLYWSEGNIEQARHHLMLCRDGKMCGCLLIQIWLLKGYKSEVDLIIAQAVLQQLCLKDGEYSLCMAEDTFNAYTCHNPKLERKEPPFDQPLLNFLYFLLNCIKRTTSGSSSSSLLATFRVLCDLYRISLRRDPYFEKYLHIIGQQYFGAPRIPRQGGGFMGGMFNDLFSRLFEEDDEDGSNVNESRQGVAASTSNAGGTQNGLRTSHSSNVHELD